MSKDVETKIAGDGLRYKSKAAGSAFSGQNFGNGNGTMSCFKCGQHKPRATGSFRMALGKSTFFCGDCKPVTPAVPK